MSGDPQRGEAEEPDLMAALKASLGLPVAASSPCRACGGRGWHTAGGNDPAACNCPAGEAWAQETTESEGR
jgi:hypothetical protein